MNCYHHARNDLSGGTTLDQRLSVITLGVADLERSVAFYENVVGWKAAPSPPGIAFFDLGGLVFALYPHDELARDMNTGAVAGPDVAFQGFALAYNARSREDVDVIFSGLREKGATIVKEPEDVFWGGYSGYFSDPDGHPWEVAYNPYWAIDEEGRISMTED